MTKSFKVSTAISSPRSKSSTIINPETKDRLLQLMDVKGISLIKASYLLKIPYIVAKQILFTQMKKI